MLGYGGVGRPACREAGWRGPIGPISPSAICFVYALSLAETGRHGLLTEITPQPPGWGVSEGVSGAGRERDRRGGAGERELREPSHEVVGVARNARRRKGAGQYSRREYARSSERTRIRRTVVRTRDVRVASLGSRGASEAV